MPFCKALGRAKPKFSILQFTADYPVSCQRAHSFAAPPAFLSPLPEESPNYLSDIADHSDEETDEQRSNARTCMPVITENARDGKTD